MDIKTNVRLPDYLQTPIPAHGRHADIVNFLLSDFDMPEWLRADLHGDGRYRPARGAIRAVLDVREHFNGVHRPVTFDEFHAGMTELAHHLPGPDQTKFEINAKVKIYWRYLQGVERQVWRTAIAVAHLRMDHFPVVVLKFLMTVYMMKSFAGKFEASNGWMYTALRTNSE